jgi:hypothetical protein
MHLLDYNTGRDLAQGTGWTNLLQCRYCKYLIQMLMCSGILTIFNPASYNLHVKHFTVT